MQAFLRSLYAEFFKTRKTLAFWSAILLPVALCGVIFAAFYVNYTKFTAYPPLILWLLYMGGNVNVMGTLILPMFVIFMTYSTNAIEHKSDTWKSMFTMPVAKWTIYSAKYFYTLFLIALSMFLFCTLTILSGNLLGLLRPQLHFNDLPIAAYAFAVYTKVFLSALGILSIQFLLSLVWADFLKPMGIGFILFIAGVISGGVGWKYAWTIPYAHPMLAIKSLPRPRGLTQLPDVELLTKEVSVGLAVAVVMFILGYFIVVRKSVK